MSDRPNAVDVHMYNKRMNKVKRVSIEREVEERKETKDLEKTRGHGYIQRACRVSAGPVGGEQGKNVRPPSSPLWNSSTLVIRCLSLSLCLYITDRL